MRVPLLLLLLALAARSAAAQPTDCAAAPADYDGPCHYGALPAVFDDFEYASGAASGRLDPTRRGAFFGENVWHTREGTTASRAWYRTNRDDLPIPGSLTFDDSVLEMRLPAGLTPEEYPRSAIVLSGFTMRGGTYRWRVRLSEQWEGQSLRHSVWLTSPDRYYFHRPTSDGDTIRLDYWSELDFENENHFQGERRNGRFYPDHVTRMSTTNHYGYLHRPEGWHRRMSRAGEVEWEDGTDTLVRAGPGTKAYTRAAPFLPTWADAWWHLTIDVDTAAQTVRYRMIPEDPADGRGDLADRIITIGPDFFPADSLAAAFSLHWLDREGRLEASLWLQADWFYHTPVTGLSDEEVLEQVALLQERGLDRVHTAGGPLFEDRSRSAALRPRITGPAQAACGRPATWTLDVAEGGTRYVVDYRYRVRRADGRLGPWQPVYAPSFTLTPRPGQAGVEIEAEVQDLWAPHGVVEGYGGWQHPHPDNQRAHVHHAAAFACGTG